MAKLPKQRIIRVDPPLKFKNTWTKRFTVRIFNPFSNISKDSQMTKSTKTQTAMQAINDFMVADQGQQAAVPAVPKKYVSLDSARATEATLIAYAIDLWYQGCKSAEEADKMVCFCKDEQDLDTFLSLFMSQGAYSQIVKEAEEIDGALVGPAEFLLPRIYFEPNSALQNQAVDVNIRCAALWFEYKFGCTNAEAELRELIEKSK